MSRDNGTNGQENNISTHGCVYMYPIFSVFGEIMHETVLFTWKTKVGEDCRTYLVFSLIAWTPRYKA